MRGKASNLAPAEYLLLSAPHDNDGVRLRRRSEMNPEGPAIISKFEYRPLNIENRKSKIEN
jgi:hypothetical protein